MGIGPRRASNKACPDTSQQHKVLAVAKVLGGNAGVASKPLQHLVCREVERSWLVSQPDKSESKG
jgi:hypothetical protein